MIVGNPLFVRGSLSSYLSHQDDALRPFVEKFLSSHSDRQDDALVQAILGEARIEPLTVSFDQVTKDAKSAKISMRDYGRDIEFDGVCVTRSYPFTGEPDLFELRPNTFTSVIPYGVVERHTVTIGLEDRNDPPTLKAELDRQEQLLKEYVDWQRPTIDAHNAALKQKIERLVADRRKHLEDVENLKDLI